MKQKDIFQSLLIQNMPIKQKWLLNPQQDYNV